jgi:hypothetical protein
MNGVQASLVVPAPYVMSLYGFILTQPSPSSYLPSDISTLCDVTLCDVWLMGLF